MKNNKVIIIAEAGVNHNRNINIAYKLIREAKRSGADYIKFQTFISENLVAKTAKLASYQKINIKKSISQQEMLKELELPYSWHSKLINYSKKIGIKFLSTPFDIESVNFLQKFKLDYIKIPSGEINNYLYLKFIGKLNKKIILSTGMSTLREIKQAVELIRKQGTPKKNITVLHCNTEYPTPFSDANIKAMLDIQNFLNNIRVGYSDHTISIEASLAAVALGATIIEKHFTLNKKFIGPDHKASLEPKEFKELVLKIRNIEKALGDGKKKISKSEKKNLKIARKSIFVLKDIKKGEPYSLQNLTTKRPATGISPMKIKYIIGKKSKKFHYKDSILKI